MPDWVETLGFAATVCVWVAFPVQLWAMWRSHQQYKKWAREEDASFGRWLAEMNKVAVEREEVDRMRAQLTIELAEARNSSVTTQR